MKNTKRVDWDGVSRRVYEGHLTDWVGWARKADVLLALAKPLEKKIRAHWKHQVAVLNGEKDGFQADLFGDAYFMLVGFALENHLKGRLIYSDTNFVSLELNRANYRGEFRTTGRLPKALQEHDLHKLAIMAGFTLTLAEEDLLRKLTRATVWAGRYPLPLHHSHALESSFSDGKRRNISGHGGNDVDRVREIVAKLRLTPMVGGRKLKLIGNPKQGRRNTQRASSQS